MASKQVVSNIKNAERARNTEPTFGFSGDPWRSSPAFPAQSQMFNYGNFGRGKDYGDNTAAYTDRYGTRGPSGEANYNQPEKPEAAQKSEAAQKGATAKEFRVTVSQVVQ